MEAALPCFVQRPDNTPDASALTEAGGRELLKVCQQPYALLPRTTWEIRPLCCRWPWYGIQHILFDGEERRFDSATGLGRVQGGTRSDRLPECGEDVSLDFDGAFMGGDFFGDGSNDVVPVFVVIEFGEEGAPWGLLWHTDGSCD